MYLSVKSVSSESRDTHSRCCRDRFFLLFLPFRLQSLDRFEDASHERSDDPTSGLWRDRAEKKFNCVHDRETSPPPARLSIIPGWWNRDNLRSHSLVRNQTSDRYTCMLFSPSLCPLIFPQVNMAIKRHASLFFSRDIRHMYFYSRTSCPTR